MIRRVKSARSGRAKPKEDPFSFRDSPQKHVHASQSSSHTTFNFNDNDTDPVPRLRQRSMSAMTPERPSTSSGLTGAKPNTFNVDNARINRRVSRDDSWLVGRSRSKSRLRTDKSKLPWSSPKKLPSPEVSPTSSPVLEASTPPVRLDEDMVGLALGSPTSSTTTLTTSPTTITRQEPVSWNSWTMGVSSSHNISKPSNLSTVTSTADLPGDAAADGLSPSKPRKTSGKWKILGLFGRKHSEPGAGATLDSDDFEASQATNRSKSKAPMAVRSQTMPNVPQIIEPEQRVRPRIDVEVPSIKFDRYSVMFGNVLQQQQQQQTELQPQPSSLLARRQATMQQLKTMENVKEEDERSIRSHQRRATSPDPTGTKTFSDYYDTSPAMTRHLNKPHRLSPLARSSTFPNSLCVPQEAYEQMSPQGQVPPHVPPKDPHYTSSPTAQPSTTPFPRTKDQKLAESKLSNMMNGYSAEIMTGSEDGEYHAVSTSNPYRPEQDPRRSPNTTAKITVDSSERTQTPTHQHHQNGQLKTPSTASSSVSSLIPGKRSPSVASTNVTQPSPRQDKDVSSSYAANNGSTSTVDSHYAQNWAAGSTGALVNTNSMDPVDVSIARQISISRQQRTLLQNSRQQRQQQQQQQQQQQSLKAERQAQVYQNHHRNRSFSVSVESSSPQPTTQQPQQPSPGDKSNSPSPTQRRQQPQQRPRAASAAPSSPTTQTFNTSSAPAPTRPAPPVRLPSTRLPRPSQTTKRKASAAAISVMTRFSGYDERVGETRSQTPTLVHVSDSMEAAGANTKEDEGLDMGNGISPGGESNASLGVRENTDFLNSPLAQQRRKSSRIILETA